MQPLDLYGRAISGIESGSPDGDYSKLGPVTRRGDRAYGRYQVMGENIPEWTRRHLGIALTPQQFLQDPTAQDNVFNGQFGDYVSKFGPEGAARAWFAGPGGMNNYSKTDQLGTSVQSYGGKFTSALNKMQGTPGGMTPNARVADGFMGLPMSPNERVADGFAAMDPNNADAAALPPTATPTAGVTAPAASPTADPQAGKDPAWVGTTGNALMNVSAILGSLGAIDGKSIVPQLAQNAMALQQANKPQWGVISEGLFGKKYGWINPNMQTVTGANGAGGGVGGAGSFPATGNTGLDDSLDKFEKLYSSGERDPDKLKATLHPLLKSEVEGALEGKASASALGRGSARQVVMMLGHYLDSNFDETSYNQRNQVAKGFAQTTPTSYGGIKLSAQTILNHAGEYLPLIDKIRSGTGLDDAGPDFARSWQQYFRSHSGNDPEFTNNLARAKQLSEGIAGETSRMQTGGPGSETTRSEYRTKLALDQPTGAIKGTLRSIVDLMDGKLQAAADQYNMAYGTQKTPRDFLEPKYKEIYDRVKASSDEAAARGNKASPSGAANDKRKPLSAF
jgi:hypothetical protein